MAGKQMRDHDTTDGDKLRIDRGDSWNVEFDDIPTSFDVLDMKVTRILEEMEAQREKIKKLEAALQQEIAENNQLQMRNAQLESVLERAKSNLERALLMKDTVREEIPNNMTSETNELREELQKLRDESQKTCDETKQNVMSETKELREELQKLRDEFRKMHEEVNEELRKQKTVFGAKFCSPKHFALIRKLEKKNKICDERVLAAMLSVDRADFCPTNTYDDKPQSIGYNTTISAPHMHAITLETLKDHLKKGASALDVGSGSGYITTCMAELVGESGRVIGIDHKKELVELAKRNIEKSHSYLLSSGRIIMVEGDGREGYANHGPYDAIHVGGATPEIPQKLFDQLAPGGCMLVPVGPAGGDQHLMRVDKDENGKMNVCHIMGVIYGALSSD